MQETQLRQFSHLQTPWFLSGAFSNTLGRRVRARLAMDSDPVRRQGPERDNAEGEVVLGASPPARPRCGRAGGIQTAARAKPARPLISATQALPRRPAPEELLVRLDGQN